MNELSGSSVIQNPGVMRRARDILSLRGIKEVPDKLNVRELTPTIDIADLALATGIVRKHYGATTAVGGSASNAVPLLYPGISGSILSTANVENKIKGLGQHVELNAAGLLATIGYSLLFKIYYLYSAVNYAISEKSVTIVANQWRYSMTLSDFGEVWIPEGSQVNVSVALYDAAGAGANFPAGTDHKYRIHTIQLVKGAKLP